MIDLTAVIGTRNQAAMLEHVLASFAAQTYPLERFEVVVVDSASDDATAAVCRAERYPFALRYACRPDSGKSVARNDGLGLARGRLVMLTDADVLADIQLVARHVAAHGEFAGAVVVGQQYMVDRPVTEAGGGRACLDPRWPHGQRLTWREFVTGNASLAREDLLAAGGFDEGFTGYGYEDYELGYRLAGRGLRFVFVPGAVNFHCHPVGFHDDLVRKLEAGRAAVRFARLHPSLRLRLHLGLTPFNRLLYRLAPPDGRLAAVCRRHADRPTVAGRLARHLLCEAAFHDGARRAWREGPLSPAVRAPR